MMGRVAAKGVVRQPGRDGSRETEEMGLEKDGGERDGRKQKREAVELRVCVLGIFAAFSEALLVGFALRGLNIPRCMVRG